MAPGRAIHCFIESLTALQQVAAWAVFGRYEFERRKFETSTQDIRANKVVIGLRASFGSDSLFDEDRNGATMDTYWPASVINTK